MDQRLIPTNLNECFEHLESIVNQDELKRFRESDIDYAHFGIGMSLRNSWGLWSGSPLKDYFRTLGIEHADDMSGIIMEQFWKHLNGLPLTVESQVARYNRHWNELIGKPHPPTPDSHYVTEY